MFHTGGVARHYGSVYAMSDYKSKAHNLYLNGSFIARENLTTYGTFIYNMSDAKLDPVDMPVPDTDGDLTHQNFTFDDMHEYSDLKYSLIGLSLGFEYRFLEATSWTVEGQYYDLTDDTGYVYGDESGSYYYITSGLKFEF